MAERRKIIVRVLGIMVAGCLGVGLLSACGRSSSSASEDAVTVTYDAGDSSLTLAVDTEIRGYAVQIPGFAANHDSDAVEELNREIAECLTALYEQDAEDAEKTPQILTEIYENDRYLQAVCSYVEYPLVGGYGDVTSYNYDRITDTRITLTDALAKAGTTLDDVRQAVTDSCLQEDRLPGHEITVYGVTVDGFVLTAEDASTFYGNVDLCVDGQTQWSYLYAYDYDAQSLRIEGLDEETTAPAP